LHTHGLASLPKWGFNLFERATKIRIGIYKKIKGILKEECVTKANRQSNMHNLKAVDLVEKLCTNAW
jgi:hypothetical protein